jgi:hypothetical protein
MPASQVVVFQASPPLLPPQLLLLPLLPPPLLQQPLLCAGGTGIATKPTQKRQVRMYAAQSEQLGCV